MTDKKDVFYYASYCRVPVYFQPEDNEVVPRNKFCGLLLEICDLLITPVYVFLGNGFPIKIYKKTITREELKKKGLVE